MLLAAKPNNIRLLGCVNYMLDNITAQLKGAKRAGKPFCKWAFYKVFPKKLTWNNLKRPRCAKSDDYEELNIPPPGGDKPPVSIKVNLKQARYGWVPAGEQRSRYSHGALPTYRRVDLFLILSVCGHSATRGETAVSERVNTNSHISGTKCISSDLSRFIDIR